MSAQVSITGPTMVLTATVADGIMAYNPIVVALADLLRTFHQSLPLSVLHVSPIGPPPDKYLYRWTAVDGRIWRQNVRLVGGAWYQTFSVQSEFLETEFSAHRPVRTAVLNAIVNIGLTDLHVTWS